jgi:hypothetical protein
MRHPVSTSGGVGESALDILRAIARSDVANHESNERNEKYERTPHPVRVNSFHSFLSSPQTVALARPIADAPPADRPVVRVAPADLAGDPEERAALIEDGAGVPRAWAEGFAELCSMPVPAGFSPGRWHRIVDAAGVFVDRWAATAVACGWSDLDVFGCHPDRPDARFDAMGIVLLLDRCEIVAVDEHGADLVFNTGARQRYRRRPLPADTVSLWDLIAR